MKLEDSIPKLEKIEGIPFETLMKKIPNLIIDKGKTGKILELLIGLPPSNKLRDFEDGELKTNKADQNGKPLETMFIMQISKNFDRIISSESFRNSRLYKKIKKGIYVPVCKIGPVENWYFHHYLSWDLKKDLNLFKILDKDYNKIREKIKVDLKNSSDRFIHTSSGDFIQIRTKDAKPYNPIYSNTIKRHVSNKNFAFYFKKEFMIYLQRKSGFKPIIL